MSILTAREIIKRLAIIDQNIMAEAARQPQMFMDAGDYRVARMRIRAQAVAALEIRRTDLARKVRKKRAALGEKLTEVALKEIVESQRSVRALKDAVDRALEAEEHSKLILEAYRQRNNGIRVIADNENLGAVRGSKEIDRIEETRKLRNRAYELEERRRRTREES